MCLQFDKYDYESKEGWRNDILIYNYLITGVAILGLILNIILLNKSKK